MSKSNYNKKNDGQTCGGCKCGCQRQTTSNHPDPFKPKEKKTLQIFSHKEIEKKIKKINQKSL